MKPLVITGLGVVSPLGLNREAFFAGLGDDDAIGRVFGKPTVLKEERVGTVRAAEVWGFDAKQFLGQKGLRNFDRLTLFLIVAAKHALEDAGLKKDGEHVVFAPNRVGICSATAYGSLDEITELNLVAELEDPRYINPAKFPNTVINAAAGYVSIWENLRAPNITIVDGNCGGLDAVLTAETHLVNRRGDAFLVGGGEVLNDPLYMACQMLGVVATPESKDGVHIGEGSAYAVVERQEDATARGARVLGKLTGYGTAFSPPESDAVLVHASAEAVGRAVSGALEDAGVTADTVDLVCASTSGATKFDTAESEGLRAIFGEHICIVAPKQIYGETFGASGALALATTLGYFAGVPLKSVTSGEPKAKPRRAVITTIGYYGNVSAVVVDAP